MEQIVINITGRGSEEQKAKVMKAVYKVLAKTEDNHCHVDIKSEHIASMQDIEVPAFMQERQRIMASATIERRFI